jgi:hypothetical protein
LLQIGQHERPRLLQFRSHLPQLVLELSGKQALPPGRSAMQHSSPTPQVLQSGPQLDAEFGTQCPAQQFSLAVQPTPHLPQFARSFDKFTHFRAEKQ